jgi:hypothetical protein
MDTRETAYLIATLVVGFIPFLIPLVVGTIRNTPAAGGIFLLCLVGAAIGGAGTMFLNGWLAIPLAIVIWLVAMTWACLTKGSKQATPEAEQHKAMTAWRRAHQEDKSEP